jgi:ligand-binding SRPBCC domain-containing protein
MVMHRLITKQTLPISPEKAWAFFSSPRNLNEITPADMRFEILSDVPEEMYEGLFIEYRVRPLFGIPMKWVTEITHVQPGRYFVDEQREGPYAIWHHEHHFKAVEGGVEMTDILHYRLPLGILGSAIAHPLLVKGRVNEIFSFREKRLIELFGRL